MAAVLTAGFFLVGNLGILGAHLWLQRSAPAASVRIDAIKNFTVVDGRVWRGAAPNKAALRDLAAGGVTTVVDLRAEDDLEVDNRLLEQLGLVRHHIPVRDGQAPSTAQVERFLEIVDASPGTVFVHCGAGVGRTGTMAAAYLVSRGGVDNGTAVRQNLAVGPPSLEQIVFAARLAKGDVRKPSFAVTAVSRLLDAPRRTWVHVRGSYTQH